MRVSARAHDIVTKALVTSILFGIELNRYNHNFDAPEIEEVSKKRIQATDQLYGFIADLEKAQVESISPFQDFGRRGDAQVPNGSEQYAEQRVLSVPTRHGTSVD